MIARLALAPQRLWWVLALSTLAVGAVAPSATNPEILPAAAARNLTALGLTAFVCYWAIRFLFVISFSFLGPTLSRRFLEGFVAFLLVLAILACLTAIGIGLFHPALITDPTGYAATPAILLALPRQLRQLISGRPAAS